MSQMEDFTTLFKSAPWEAIGVAVAAGIGWLWKNKSEKKAQTESRDVDSREIVRLNKVVDQVIKERDDADGRADAAFAKQLELTERFSDMRAQNAQVLSRMEQLSEQMHNVLEENGQLRAQVAKLSEELHSLRTALRSGEHL